MDGLPGETLLFLDLASPPLLACRSHKPFFFSGGYPLTRYISGTWKPLPELDTSGGNVTYAALSLAEQLGAREIELYGADFSYPNGESYARGAYIYSYFAKQQNRYATLEAQASAFLFRTPLEKKTLQRNEDDHSWYYETKALKFYRERLEEKSAFMNAVIHPIEGSGAPINLKPGKSGNPGLRIFSSGKSVLTADDFLLSYRRSIAALPDPGKITANYLSLLTGEARSVFATILPAAAAFKRRNSLLNFRDVFEETRKYCLKEIDMIIKQFPKTG